MGSLQCTMSRQKNKNREIKGGSRFLTHLKTKNKILKNVSKAKSGKRIM